jgi:hypothetical protein
LLAGVQPGRLGRIDLSADGLLQRFLPTMMGAGRAARDEPAGPTAEAYERLVFDCIDFKPRPCTMAPDAMERTWRMRQLFFDLADAGEALSPGFRNFASKLPGVAGNLALILQVARDPRKAGDRVDDDTMQAVEKIIHEFILPHARCFYETQDFVVGTELMRSVASYILTSAKPCFVPSDFTSGVAGLRGLDLFRLKTAVSTLVAGGWLAIDERNPSKPKWTVLPGVAERMALRREDEERRKLALRRLMNAGGSNK